jgi:tryptophan synthase alpha chain
MSRIAERFAALRAKGEKGLVAYIAAGDPSLAATAALVKGMEAAGVDMIELGLPFSDPLADGPTIQAGSQRALAGGANTNNVLALVRTLRDDGVKVPFLIMTYYNLLLRPGLSHFCAQAKEAGVDGLIIPDVPIDEAEELMAAAAANALDLVQFVAPTSPPDRVAKAAQAATGFVYCVSLTGVTGTRAALPERFKETVREARRHTQTPIAVGFGIASPDQVRAVAQIADAVIVGSAIVKLCGLGLPESELVRQVSEFVGELKAATRPTAAS